MRDRAQKEKWTDARIKARQNGSLKAAQKAAQKTAEAAAQNAVKLERARGLAIDQVLRALEGMPKNGGTHTRQSQTDKQTGKMMSIDYDLQTLINALEKLSTGSTADIERQKRFVEENNTVMASYADLFSRPARRRTIEQLEAGGENAQD